MRAALALNGLNKKTLNKVKQKHPQGKEAGLDVLLTDTPEQVHPITFDAIDADLVKRAAVKTRDGAGPSGLDADGWRRVLITKQFGNSFTDLQLKLHSLQAFLACCLIPLDKNPGLRPIGIGEILHRIADKVIVSNIRKDLISSVGSLQVCAGHEAACESIIHAMHEFCEEEE